MQITPAYLLLGKLPCGQYINKHMFYSPIDKARRLAKLWTIKFHNKNKINYDVCFRESNFNVRDLISYEDLQYSNT